MSNNYINPPESTKSLMSALYRIDDNNGYIEAVLRVDDEDDIPVDVLQDEEGYIHDVVSKENGSNLTRVVDNKEGELIFDF